VSFDHRATARTTNATTYGCSRRPRASARTRSTSCAEARWDEHLSPEISIGLLDVLDRHATGEARGDDRTGRYAAGEIEIVAEQQAGIVSAPSQQSLDRLEIFEREHPLDAAAVQREDAFWGERRIEMLGLGQRQRRLPCKSLSRPLAGVYKGRPAKIRAADIAALKADGLGRQ
jgi:hypothetical protein